MELQKHILETDALYQYLISISLRENDIQALLREETVKRVQNPQMMTSPEQAQFLNFMIKTLGASKIMEIGVFTGYGSLAMALALPENGILVACEINADMPEIGRPFWKQAGINHKIQLKIAPALETLKNLLAMGDENFDLIFIDADKLNYPLYYEYSLQLLRPGGLILLDNVLSFGNTRVFEATSESAKVMQKLNQQLHEDSRVSISLVPIGGGTFMLRKRT
jgi:predicted O-methyltransferase YrrM